MKITAIQLNYKICDLLYNFNKIKRAIYKNSNSDILVFSELCLLGYYPYDLLLNDSIFEKQNKIIEKLLLITKSLDIMIVIGIIYKEKSFSKLFNSALVIKSGKKICLYHKQLLPSYDIFNEERHFLSGSSTQNNIFYYDNKKIAILICEDLWFKKEMYFGKKSPINLLSTKSIDYLIIINASPSKLHKHQERLNNICKTAIKLNSYVIYVSQIGGYDGIVYDGNSFICNSLGKIIKHTKSFQEDQITFNDTELYNKHIILNPKENIEKFIVNHLILGIKDYVLKSGYKSVVIALSGGIDSAVTLFLSQLALGKNNVTAIYMPCIFSAKKSLNLSIKLCKNLDVKIFKRNITEEFKLSCKNFITQFGNFKNNETKENMQARIRGRIVMEYANDNYLLCLSTSNKSELSIGYTTIYGDMCGAISCLGDLYKTEVYKLAEYINNTYNNVIPHNIIDRDPSAELSKNQKDSDKLISYDKLDAFLQLMLESKYLSSKKILVFKKIVKTIKLKDKKNILKMFNNSKFKRNQLPHVISIRYNTFNIGYTIPSNSLYKFNFIK